MMKALVIALSLPLISASRSSRDTSTISIPKAPYGASAFLIDYGILLDNYQYILSAEDLTNKTLRTAIRTFIAPLKDFQASYDLEDATNEKRKNHLVGLSSYLTENMNTTEISSEDWKDGSMWNAVMNRENVSKALQTRSDLLAMITESATGDKATIAYQTTLKRYNKILHSSSEGHFSRIISRDIDWNLFESRYYRLVMTLKGRDKNQAGRVRKYLATFLRDGDPQNSQYEKLVKSKEDKNDEEEAGFLKRTYGKFGKGDKKRDKATTSTTTAVVVSEEVVISDTTATVESPVYYTTTSCACTTATRTSRRRAKIRVRSDADFTTPGAIAIFTTLLVIFVLI